MRRIGRDWLWPAKGVATVVAGAGSLLILGAISGVADPGGAARSRTVSLTEPRLVVLKSKRVLHLFDGGQLVRSYPIDLGFRPRGQKRWMGDGRTPIGSFRVVTKNPDSAYHRFVGIDYPNRSAAVLGLAAGLISPGEAASIELGAASVGSMPWRTALGGGVGIHGKRVGRDWTGGCIALADRDVEELFDVLRIGDPVEILP